MRVCLLLLALTTGPAAAQERALPTSGTELFRGLLHRNGFQPAAGPDDDPQVMIVVGMPYRSMPQLAEAVRQVRSNGGGVLVVTDPADRLGDYFPDLPRLKAVPSRRDPWAGQRLDTGQLVVRLDPVEPDAGGLELPVGVAASGAFGLTDFTEGRRWERLANRGRDLVGVWSDRPGRAAILSDVSVLSNLLIAGRYDDGADTGNLQLAVNLVRWLRPPGDGPVRCLFVENGQVVSRFDDVDYTAALLPAPAPPPLSAFLTPEAQAKLTDAANEAFDRVETDDRLNSALTRGRRYGRTMRWLLGVLALLAAVALVRRARAARNPPDTPTPAVPPRPTGPLARRREELLRGGDHTAAVREFLVDLFRHHGLPLDQYRHPPRMPRVEADPATRRRLATLWEAAYGPAAVTYTRWKELEPMIEAVRADGAAGRWRFAEGRA